MTLPIEREIMDYLDRLQIYAPFTYRVVGSRIEIMPRGWGIVILEMGNNLIADIPQTQSNPARPPVSSKQTPAARLVEESHTEIPGDADARALGAMTKTKLFAHANMIGVTVRPSWTKSQIIAHLIAFTREAPAQ